MKDDDKRYEAPFMTLAEIKRRFPLGELNNDRIEEADISIIGHYGELVCPWFRTLKFPNGLCAGYASTANIGFIIRRMSQLLDLFDDDERSFLKAIHRTPIRLYTWGMAGDSVMDTICVGHFIEDRFIFGADLMKTGLMKDEINHEG